MAEEQDAQPGFKVVDRRSFTSEGTRRPEAADEPEKAGTRSAPPPAPSAASAPEPELGYEESASDFETLVSFLSTTAMFQMGLLPGPGGERISPDLANARRTIDLLEVLQHKTQGNLTPDEARLLEDVLYELRISFVEMEKRLAKKGK